MFKKAPSQQIVQETVTRPLNDTLKGAFDKMDLQGDFFTQLHDIGFSDQDLLNLNDAGFNELINKLGGIKEGSIEAGQAMTQLGTTVRPVLKEVEGGTSIFSNFGAKLTSIASAALTSVAISAAIGLITKGIELFWNNVIKAEENAIKKGQEAKKAIDDIQSGVKDNQDFIDKNGERYTQLHAGVDQRTGKNVSLSSDEYQEYIDLSNQIAEIYPSVVKSYDAQGNAILNLSSNIDTATNSLKEFLEQDKIVAGMDIAKNLDAEMNSAIIQTNKLENKITEATRQRDEYLTSAGTFFGEVTTDSLLSGGIKYSNHEEEQIINKAIDDAAKQIGITISRQYGDTNNEMGGQGGEISIPLILNPQLNDEGTFQDFVNNLNTRLESSGLTSGGVNQQAAAKQQAAINSYQAEIDKIWNEIVPDITDSFMANPNYNLLSEDLQNGIANVISNIDFSKIKKPDSQTWSEFFETEYLDPILTGIDSADPAKVNKAIADLLKPDFTDGKTDAAIRDTVEDTLNSLFAGEKFEGLRQELRIALDFVYLDEDGNEIWNYQDVNERLYDMFGINPHTRESQSNLTLQQVQNDLTADEKQALIQGFDTGYFDFDARTILFDELIEKIHRYQESLKEVKTENTDILADIFNDETYQSNAEGYEKALSSLTSALETLKTDGKLTAEAMRDLQEEFPNLTQFTQEEISDAALGKLGEWISEFKDDLDTLSPEGLEQVRTYVDNLVLSFGNLDVSASEARKAIIEGFLDDLGNTPEAFDVASERAEDAMNDLISQIEASGKDVNYQLIWQLAMEDRFSDPAADLYQEYNNKELRWQVTVENQDIENEVNDIEKEISGRASRKSVNEATRSYIESTGETDLSKADKAYLNKKTEDYYEAEREYGKGSKEALAAQRDMKNAYEDYQTSSDASWEETLENDAADVQDTLDKYNLRAEAYQNLVQATGADTSSQEYKDMQDAKAAYYQALTTQAQDQQSADQDAIKPYTQAIENSTTEATKLQNQIDETKNKGQRISKEVYDALAAEYETQAESQDSIAEFWDGIAQDTSRSGKDRADAAKAAADARKEAISLRQTGRETGYMFGTDEIEEYQNALTDLQSEATKYENELNAAELKHQKTSEKTYQKLIGNGKSQIDNLKDQKKEYQDLRDTAKLLGDVDSMRKWQQEMDNVDSSIASMQSNIASWSDTMTSLVSTNAASLSSTLSSAFSEIASGTGLTIDTMNELLRQFSDLQGFDVSNIFYATADGMKFNAQAAENLVEAEYQLQASNLVSAIEEQNQIIEKQSQLHTEDAQSAIDAANQKIAAYTRELSSLQALYDQQKEAFSDFQAWQTAESTANKGDRYTTIQGALENMQKAYDSGLTGTDEFKAFTSMIDEWGMNTVEAYDRNIEKIKRYFTEDASGISNFYKDAIDKGFGEETAAGMELHLPDVDEFADAMDITREMADILISRAEDYGATNTWVESSVDGMLKQKEVMEDIATEYQRLAEMKRGGATADEIANEEQKIAEMVELNKEIAENTQTVTEREGKVTAEELNAGIARFRELQKAYSEDKVIDEETFKRQAQQLAEETHIKLTPEWDEIDAEAMEDAFPGLEVDVTPVLKPLEEVSEGVRNEGFDSTYTKIASALENNPELLSGVQKAFQGLDLDIVKNMQLKDGSYDFEGKEGKEGYVELEKQLDLLGQAVGLTADEIKEYLIPAISEGTTAFEETSEQKTYDIPEESVAEKLKTSIDEKLQSVHEYMQEKHDKEAEQAPTVNAVAEAASTVVDGFTSAISTLSDAIIQAVDGKTSKEQVQPIESYGTLGVGTAPAMPVQPVAQTTEQAIQLADQEQYINVVVNRDAYDSLIENVKETAEKIIDAKKGDIDTALSEIKTAAEAEKIEVQVDAKAGELGNTIPELQSQVDGQEKLKAEVDAKEGSIGNAIPGLQSLIDGMPKLEADVDAKAGTVGDVTTTLQSQIDGQEHLEAQTDAKAGSADKVIPGLQSIVDQLKHPEVEVDGKPGDLGDTEPELQGLADIMEIKAEIDGKAGNVDGVEPTLQGFADIMDIQAKIDGKAGNVSGVEEGLQSKADGMSVNAKINGKAGEISTALSSMQANADANPIKVPMVGYFAEGAETPEIEAPTVNVSADSSKVVAATEEAAAAAGSMPSETTVEINGDASGFNSTKDSVQQDLQVLDGTTVDATINATGNAQSTISSVSDELTRLNGREAVTRIITEHITRNKSDAGGQNNGGIALANGTKDKDLLSTPYNNSTLVGEENPELHISKEGGYWQLVGQDGPEFRNDIAPGDIVFNAQQTKKLLKNGHINSRGKALAGGTQKIGGLSFDGGTTPSGGSTLKTVHSNPNGPSSDKVTEKTTKEQIKVTKDSTDATKDNTQSTTDATSAIDKFTNWAGQFKDWIEVLLERLTTKMERALAKSENANGYAKKNEYVDQAMDYNNQLLQANKDGAKKYISHNKRVVRKAQKIKYKNNKGKKVSLISKKEANDLTKKIENGELSIEDFSKYMTKKKNKKGADTEKVQNRITAFIEEYQKWYEKIEKCRDAQEECIAKNKELQAQKLTNITEQFETFTGLMEAYNNTSQAFINLGNANGQKLVNDKDFQQKYDEQMTRQNYTTGYLKQQRSAYAAELANAANIYGVDSNEYREAYATFEQMNAAIYESEQKYYELRKAKAEMEFTAIQNVANRIKSVGDRINSLVQLNQKRGEASPEWYENQYADQIQVNNALIGRWEEIRQEALKYIGENQLKEGSAEYEEYAAKVAEAEQNELQLMTTNEDLKDSIREMRWKEFDDLREKVKNITSDFEHLRDLIRDQELFDTDLGLEMTEKGYVNLMLIAESLAQSKQNAADAREALVKLQEELDEKVITQDEYNEKSREQIDIIKSEVKAQQQLEDQAVSVYKTRIQNEQEALEKLISLRSEALQKKKEYYDYDKQLKSSNKDINQLQAQINALSGVTNAAALAERARLQAELKEKQNDLADIRFDHSVNIQQQGYDKLQKDSNDALQQTLKDIDGKQEVRDRVVQSMLGQLVGRESEVDAGIKKLIADTGTYIGPNTTFSNNMTELVNRATSSSTDASKIASTIKTDKIDTTNSATNNIETLIRDDIQKDLNAVKAIVTDDTNAKGIGKGITTISEALNKFKSKFEEYAKLKDDQETNPPTNPTANGGLGDTTGGTGGGGGTDATSYDKMATDALNAVKAASQDYTKNNAKSWQSANALIKTANDNRNSMSEAGRAALEKAYAISNKHTDLLTTNNAFVKYLQKEGKATKSITSKANDFREYLVTNFGYDLGNYDDNYAKYNILATKIKGGAGVRKNNETAAAFMKRLLTELRGYSKGTLGTKYNEINWTHAGEIIRRSDGAILRQLPKGTQVVPKIESENLMKWAQIDPFKELSESIGNMQTINNAGNQQQNVYYDALIQINGNVDNGMMDRIEELGTALLKSRNFMQKQFDYNSKEFNREFKKLH